MSTMNKAKRRIMLDTETTGMPASDGHRIIEIGCVEMLDRELTGNHLKFTVLVMIFLLISLLWQIVLMNF